jgi:type II secretory pathway component GspD/PulD (secretin)
MRHLLALWLVIATGAAFAQGAIEVITLRHRTADQVIPVLQPLLEPGGALSGQAYQLIVRTSPGNLAQLRDVLAAIDRPARRLMISVRFDSVQDNARSRADADVRISNRGASADVRVLDSRSAQDERVDQRLQVLEGGQAHISTGEARLYGEAATGFMVAPRVSGSNVTLDIHAQQEAFAQRGAIRGQQASSTVSGRLGEWIELGGASSSAMGSGTGTLSSRQGARSSDRRVWLKVEEIR